MASPPGTPDGPLEATDAGSAELSYSAPTFSRLRRAGGRSEAQLPGRAAPPPA